MSKPPGSCWFCKAHGTLVPQDNYYVCRQCKATTVPLPDCTFVAMHMGTDVEHGVRSRSWSPRQAARQRLAKDK